jgi:hypothetical protein
MLTKEQLQDIVEEWNRNLYNYRHEQGKANEILWKKYNALLSVPKAKGKKRPTVLPDVREQTEGEDN